MTADSCIHPVGHGLRSCEMGTRLLAPGVWHRYFDQTVVSGLLQLFLGADWEETQHKQMIAFCRKYLQ